MENYYCPKCGNKELRYFGKRKGEIYCRRCIQFSKSPITLMLREDSVGSLDLAYNLTSKQQEISQKILNNYQNKLNSYVHAVCGAGKTEIVFATILYALSKGERVGFAIPRRDVVIELAERLKEAFPNNTISCLFGGSADPLVADIVVLTTHQLYQFKEYFSLIILDEADAFPYADDFALNSFFQKSIKGNYIVMSATANKKTLREFKNQGGKVLELLSRYHQHPLPVPQISIKKWGLINLFVIHKLKEFSRQKKPCFVFCPTISGAEKLFQSIRKYCKNGEVVHSKKQNRTEIISSFKKGTYQYLVTTSILERGVTIANLQVLVVEADHEIFSCKTLVQISGRVGRKELYPNGEVIFVAKRVTSEMEKAIAEIKSANRSLSNLLPRNL